MKRKFFALLGSILCCSPLLLAQFPEDALRLSYPGLGVGAKSLGMGGAFIGVADDFTATFWNPSGLAQQRHYEISGGLSHISYGNTSTFFNQSTDFSNSATSINNFGIVLPVPATRGSLVFGFGYNRATDFTSALAFDGFNPRSSMILSLTPSTTLPPKGSDARRQFLDNNIPFQLYLANIDTVRDVLFPLVSDSVNQRGTVLEGSGINHWSVAGAIDIARNFSIGATLTFISGSYFYDRNYIEEDTKNVYHFAPPYDFKRLILDNRIDWDLTGYGFKIGAMYRVKDAARLGVTVKFPTIYTVKERFNTGGQSFFKNGDQFSTSVGGSSEYDVHTPYVFGGGFSFNVAGFALAGDAEYTDWTQMEFKNPTSNIIDLLKENSTIKSLFRSTTNLRGGVEYRIPGADISLRGGFIYNPSPFKGDPSSFDQKFITGGIGFLVQESIALDIAYAHGYWKTFHVNYDASSRTDEDVKTDNVFFTIAYRF